MPRARLTGIDANGGTNLGQAAANRGHEITRASLSVCWIEYLRVETAFRAAAYSRPSDALKD